MPSGQDLINLTRSRYLLSGAAARRNMLSAAINPSIPAGTTGTISLQFAATGIAPGQLIGIDLELFTVWAVNGSTITVSGGQDGTLATTHLQGALVYLSPTFSDWQIWQALNEEILALGAPATGLFQVKQTEFAFSATLVGYDLPGVSDITDVLEVRYDDNLPYQRTPRIDRSEWRLERNYLASEDSSGVSLKLYRGGYPGRNVTVIYRTGFTALTAPTDDLIAVSGLPATAADIPPLGAALRVGVGREVRRNDITSQGDTRRAEEVPPAAVGNSYAGLRALRQQRIVEEASRLAARYPPVRS